MAKENKVLTEEFAQINNMYLSGSGQVLYIALKESHHASTLLSALQKWPETIASYGEPDGSPGFGINLKKLKERIATEEYISFTKKVGERFQKVAAELHRADQVHNQEYASQPVYAFA